MSALDSYADLGLESYLKEWWIVYEKSSEITDFPYHIVALYFNRFFIEIEGLMELLQR